MENQEPTDPKQLKRRPVRYIKVVPAQELYLGVVSVQKLLDLKCLATTRCGIIRLVVVCC